MMILRQRISTKVDVMVLFAAEILTAMQSQSMQWVYIHRFSQTQVYKIRLWISSHRIRTKRMFSPLSFSFSCVADSIREISNGQLIFSFDKYLFAYETQKGKTSKAMRDLSMWNTHKYRCSDNTSSLPRQKECITLCWFISTQLLITNHHRKAFSSTLLQRPIMFSRELCTNVANNHRLPITHSVKYWSKVSQVGPTMIIPRDIYTVKCCKTCTITAHDRFRFSSNN